MAIAGDGSSWDGRSRQQLGMAGHGSSWGWQVMAVAGDARSWQ